MIGEGSETEARRLRAWSAANRGNVAIRRELVRRIRGYAQTELDEAGAILDVGCGVGWLLRELAQDVEPTRLHGVDLRADRVQAAARSLPGATIAQADARRLPLPDGRFDLVLLLSTLSSVSSDDAALMLGEALRVLRPGGALLVYDPRLTGPRRSGMRLIKTSELRRTLGEGLRSRTLTLNPLVARRLGLFTPILYPPLAMIPLSRSHRLWIYRRPAEGSSREREAHIAAERAVRTPAAMHRREQVARTGARAAAAALQVVVAAAVARFTAAASALRNPRRRNRGSRAPGTFGGIPVRRLERSDAGTTGRVHVWMFVRNACTHDHRVLREAKTLAAVGYDVTIVAVLRPGLSEKERRDGFEIVRVPIMPPHYRLLRRYRRMPHISRKMSAARRRMRLRWVPFRRRVVRRGRIFRSRLRVLKGRLLRRRVLAWAAMRRRLPARWRRVRAATVLRSGRPHLVRRKFTALGGGAHGLVRALTLAVRAAGRGCRSAGEALVGARVRLLGWLTGARSSWRWLARAGARVSHILRLPQRVRDQRVRAHIDAVVKAAAAGQDGASAVRRPGPRTPGWWAVGLLWLACAVGWVLYGAVRLLVLIGRLVLVTVLVAARLVLAPASTLGALRSGCYEVLKRSTFRAHRPLLLWDFTVRSSDLVLRCVDPLEGMEAASAHVFHAHDLNTLLPATLIGRAAGGKVVYDSHELHMETASACQRGELGRAFLRRYERTLIGHADATITVNDSLSDVLRDRYGIGRPLVLRNTPEYIDQPDFQPDLLRSELGIPAATRIALYHGNIAAHRGLEELLMCVEHLDESVAVVLLGSGSMRDEMERRMIAMDLENRVLFHDAVTGERLAGYLRSADVGVIPIGTQLITYYYSLPNKLFELMMAGRPVAATALPEIRRVVEGYQIGAIFAPHDPPAMAAGIMAVLDSPDYDAMCMRARRGARTHSWDVERVKLIALYEDIAPMARALRSEARRPIVMT